MTEYTEYAQLPIVLSVEQVAKVLGIGKNTAYELVRSGRIRSVRTGHKIRISKTALYQFLEAC